MKRFLSEQFTATFAGDLHRRLSEPRTFSEKLSEPAQNKSVWLVSGLLALMQHEESGRTKCKILLNIQPDWLVTPPNVLVQADFIRRHRDWHVNESDGSLCYVLQREWADRLDALLERNGGNIALAIDYAATWCLASTDSLVTRHCIAERHNIVKWPENWAAYAHGEAGTLEYLREHREFADRQKSHERAI